MKTLTESWNGFWAIAHPKGAGMMQTTECKKAFFAGVAVALQAMSEIAEELDEEQGAVRLEQYFRELRATVDELIPEPK